MNITEQEKEAIAKHFVECMGDDFWKRLEKKEIEMDEKREAAMKGKLLERVERLEQKAAKLELDTRGKRLAKETEALLTISGTARE